MRKTPLLLLMTVLALGWLFDFLFWRQSVGINIAIFIVLCLVAGFFLLARTDVRPVRGSLTLIPLILFFAAITFVRSEPVTLFLAIVLTAFLLGVLANTFARGGWYAYG